jgi:CheY-like chemotaxis protein
MDVSYDEQQIDTVLADTNRMTQVLVNLITNAIKFTAKKDGERNITVSLGVSQVRPTSYPPNVVFFSPDAKAFHIDSTMGMDWGGGATAWLMVAVRDTGIGITAENQRKLFERFRQATPKTQETYGGSGLGLFISRKLCQLHGGDIGVSSKEGVGSTFGFFFKVRHVESTSSDGRPSLGKRNTSRSSRSVMQSPSPSDYNFPHPSGDMAIRPKPTTLTSHEGVDADQVKDDRTNDSLENPPTEHHIESHGRAATPDERFSETQKIAEKVEDKHQLITIKNGPAADLRTGETQRQGDAATKISQAQSKETADTRPTLLLVEDNLINQKVLRRQLQSRGFEVFVANNGQEAIDAVEERGRKATDTADFHNYFDCILMDQEMPIKDGNAATVEIRQLQEQGKAGRGPILGVSANVRDAQTDAMRKAGMDDIIGKPFKVDKLVEMIRSLISSR